MFGPLRFQLLVGIWQHSLNSQEPVLLFAVTVDVGFITRTSAFPQSCGLITRALV